MQTAMREAVLIPGDRYGGIDRAFMPIMGEMRPNHFGNDVASLTGLAGT